MWQLLNLKSEKAGREVNSRGIFTRNKVLVFYTILNDCKKSFYGPIIKINEEDLNLDLNNIFSNRFQILSLVCPKCGLKDNVIIKKFATYS